MTDLLLAPIMALLWALAGLAGVALVAAGLGLLLLALILAAGVVGVLHDAWKRRA